MMRRYFYLTGVIAVISFGHLNNKRESESVKTSIVNGEWAIESLYSRLTIHHSQSKFIYNS